MQIRVNAGAATLAAAAALAGTPELKALSVDGPFLAFDFGDDTLEEALTTLRVMDEFVGGRIADADSHEVASALSGVKGAIVSLERDVTREFSLRTPAGYATPEPVEPVADAAPKRTVKKVPVEAEPTAA